VLVLKIVGQEGSTGFSLYEKSVQASLFIARLQPGSFQPLPVAPVPGRSGICNSGGPPSPQPGLLIYIMVDSVETTIEKILAHSVEIVQPTGACWGRSDLRLDVAVRTRQRCGNID
jgi:predicted enzyme related to lactoylglutathione lyase